MALAPIIKANAQLINAGAAPNAPGVSVRNYQREEDMQLRRDELLHKQRMAEQAAQLGARASEGDKDRAWRGDQANADRGWRTREREAAQGHAFDIESQRNINAMRRAEQASNLAVISLQRASELNRPKTSAPAPVGTSFGTADATQSAAYKAAQAALQGAQQAQAEQNGTAAPPPAPGQVQPVQPQATPPVPAQAAPAQPAAPTAPATARANVPVSGYTSEDIAGVYANGGRVFTGFGSDADGFSPTAAKSPYDDPLRSYMFSLGGGTFA